MTDNPDHAAKQAAEAAKKRDDDTRKRLSEERSAREKAHKEAAKAAEGVYLAEHEADGSPEDNPEPDVNPRTKHLEANKPKTYATRSTTPA